MLVKGLRVRCAAQDAADVVVRKDITPARVR
jgi:hypothetical protein